MKMQIIKSKPNLRTEGWLLKLYLRWLSMSNKYCRCCSLLAHKFKTPVNCLNTSNPWLPQKLYWAMMKYSLIKNGGLSQLTPDLKYIRARGIGTSFKSQKRREFQFCFPLWGSTRLKIHWYPAFDPSFTPGKLTNVKL